MKATKLILLLFVIGVTACKKEKKIGDINAAKKPPVANAGPDQHLTAPTDNFILDGSASIDPDGQITVWRWTKISGPGQVIVNDASQKNTNVKVTLTGLYQFELQVKDNDGLIASDSVNIFLFAPGYFCDAPRPVINSKLTPFWQFPFERFGMSVATLGNKVYFAGGRDMYTGDPTAQVVILDMITKQETQASLSIPRAFIGCATAGNKIFFAGGWTWSGALSRVEIVDVTSNASQVAELSVPRFGVVTATVGNKVFFAGGYYYTGSERHASSRIDIYDLTTDSWSTSELSEGRGDMAAVVVDRKLYFAGGDRVTTATDAIDIYDEQANTWSTARLNSPVANPAAVTTGNKIYLAGGYTITLTAGGSLQKNPKCEVQINDAFFQSLNAASLTKSISHLVATKKNNQLIFFPGPDVFSYFFDVYDISSNSWSVGLIGNGLRDGVRFVYNNELYIAGGYFASYVYNDVFNDKIMKLEFY